MEYSKEHSILRALERYNLALNEEHIDILANKIRHGKGRFIAESYYSYQEWNVYYLGQIIRIIYDPATNRIITMLPPFEKKTFLYGERGQSFMHNKGNTHSRNRKKLKATKRLTAIIEEEELRELGAYDAIE